MQKNDTHNVEQFKINLESYNWKDIQQDTYIGVEFDLTASKKIGIGKQKLLVKHFQKLDEDTLSVWVKHYDEIDKSPKKLVGAQTFTLCIFAETITENALNLLSTFPFKNFGQLASTGGKGIALIVDFKLKQIYGRQPGISKPFKKIFKEFLECIKNTYQISEIRKSPKPEVTYKKMKLELKKWGFGLMGFGALHIVLASVLNPVWGVILIIVGICNILIPHRALFLVNGFAIMTAAVFNMAAMEKDAGAFGMLIIMQFVWGIFEIRKFKLYDEVKW